MNQMKNNKNNNLLMGSLCALGCETLYGLSYSFTKQATAGATVLSLLGWRFFVAFAIMSIFVLCGMMKVNLRGKKIRPVLLAALFNPAIYFIAETVGISRISCQTRQSLKSK